MGMVFLFDDLLAASLHFAEVTLAAGRIIRCSIDKRLKASTGSS
jgi:hypothetical protein